MLCDNYKKKFTLKKWDLVTLVAYHQAHVGTPKHHAPALYTEAPSTPLYHYSETRVIVLLFSYKISELTVRFSSLTRIILPRPSHNSSRR